MDYPQTLEYLYSHLPMFHRIGPAAYKPGLDNTLRLLEAVGNPHLGLKTVHVAGTNGKGSTSHMIASTLQEAGYKTGLYTSPHLKDFRERIRINGVMIPQHDVVEFVKGYREKWVSISPSFFEICVAMCFWYFQKEKTDIAVIETGLGGRLDSTNVIQPELAVITNIGLDHMNLLGDSIEKIAAEKAGIIKTGIPVVIGPMRPNARQVICAQAQSHHSSIIDASSLSTDEVPSCELMGIYQEENRKTACMSIKKLQELGWNISDENMAQGFMHVTRNTGLLGRWQVLGQKPTIIADVAHNEDGIIQVVKQLKTLSYNHLHFVLGMVNDKDISKVLSLLPKNATYYFCKANIPRGLDAALLRDQAMMQDLHGEAYGSVADAFSAAQKHAAPDDLVFAGGSVFTVAEVL